MEEDRDYERVKTLSLYRFTNKDIANKIKEWVYNDINYKNNLFQTKKILSTHLLSGQVISAQPTNNAKLIVQNYLLTFVTSDTLDIMFDCFDEYKKKYIQHIKSKSAQQIASILFHFPLNNLIKRIINENIDGKTFINALKDRRYDIIKEETGWKDEEIYQIEAILLRHYTFTPSEFKLNMEYVFKQNYAQLLSKHVIDKMKEIISHFDIQELHYKIKNAQNIDTFSDSVINIVDELIENESMAVNVSIIYQFIAQCFIFNDDLVENDDLSLEERQHFICNNCGNCNINCFIESRINIDLSICSLCGLSQKESIILKLRNQKTFIMVNDVDKEEIRDDIDDIDSLIQTAAKHGSFSLFCPNRNDNTQCPSIIRLSKKLIIYKRWLQTIKDDDINKTIKVDITQFVDSNILKKALMKSCNNIKDITKNDTDILMRLFDEEMDVKAFLNMKRIEFIRYCKKYTTIKPAFSVKLYSKTLKILKKECQTKEFGRFLSDIDMDTINKDYYHILKTHINNGNQSTIKDTFRFFENVVHYEDSQSQITDCRSTKRRQQRVHDLCSKTPDNIPMNDDKNIWKLKQFYNQNQLDIIHSFLVHSKWQYFVKRYMNQQKDDDDIDIDKYDEDESIQNKDKYMTDSSDSNTANYGFGIEHCHPHLSPKYCSIHDELVQNTLSPLTENCFQNLLIKAIKLHNIAMTKEFNKELICKYFDLQYNIIRNESIGLRHIFAIIIYTDISSFCTCFRSTYRTINNETNADQVTRRHKQLYYYSRCLFEAIEFFGQYMEPDLKVFHGLNRVMHFEKFTAYFNQPISTTTSLTTAAQFADGKGIILTLKSATEYLNDNKIPKYLSVSWLSCFPNEDEKLFYGAYVVFQIDNIIEAETLVGHSKELLMLNKFQKTVQNQNVYWDVKDAADKKKIEALVTLIKHLQESKGNEIGLKSKYITEYGQALFHYFCNNCNTNWICIRNYKLLPGPLQNALFFNKKRRKRISLMPLIQLFPNLREIVLNELEIQQMTADAKNYVEIVLEYINYSNKTSVLQMLDSVTLKSKQQRDRKQNSTLQNLVNKYAASYGKYHWSLKYQFLMENTHNLMFTNNNAVDFMDEAVDTMDEKDDKMDEEDDKMVEPFSFSLRSYIDESLPSYFMQITFIDEDGFHIEILSDQISGTKRKFFIKEMNYNKHSSIRSIERRIKIEKGESRGSIDVDIHEDHDAIHYLALYDNRKATEPIPNSMQMQLIVLKDQIDEYYKPNCIDSSTVFKINHETDKHCDIYWLIPPQSFGDISYKIIKDDIESKEDEIILSLPYSVSYAMTPTSFQVITVTKLGDVLYESYPSQSITIESMLPNLPIKEPILMHWKCRICTYSNTQDASKCVMCGLAKDANVQTKGLAKDVFLTNDQIPETKGWKCSACTFTNHGSATKCAVCGLSMKESVAVDIEAEQMFDKTNNPESNKSWMCNVCTLHNDAKYDKCQTCHAPKPINDEPSPFIMDPPPFNMKSPPFNMNTAHGMSTKNVFADNMHKGNQLMGGTEQKYDDAPVSISQNVEPTIDDFNRAASDIACYNENPTAVFSTLKSVAKKLLKDDIRYRTLDTTNAKVMERLIGFEGVMDFLMLLGFESDAMGMKLVCTEKPSSIRVQNAISVLNSYASRFSMKHKSNVDDNDNDDDDRLTLEQIVLWQTAGNERDNSTMETLLMTHKLFSDSLSLIKVLKKRFFTPIPSDILNVKDAEQKESKIKEYKTNVQKRIHLKMIKALRDWMKHYWREDFNKNDAVKYELEQWLKEIILYAEMDVNKDCKWIMLLHKVIEKEYQRYKQIDCDGEWKQKLNISAIYDDVHVSNNSNLDQISAQDLSDQITLMDERLFSMVQPREYVHRRWKNRNNKEPVVLLLFIKQFNNLCLWAQVQILKPKRLKDRTKAIKRMIKMCERFNSIKNYNSLCSVYTALDSAPIHRLKLAWKRVGTAQMSLFQEYGTIFSRDYNHRNLRQLLREAKGACIPHIGTALQDFVFITDGSMRKESGVQLVDFNKCVRIADRIKQLQSHQLHMYSSKINENKKIQKMLWNEFETVNDITEDDVWDMSTAIKKTDEKEVKRGY